MGLTPKQMQTKLAIKLRDIFDSTTSQDTTLGEILDELDKLKGDFPPGPPPPPLKKKKKKKDDDKEEHADVNEPPAAVLGKGQDYAQRGSDFIREAKGRGVYNVFAHLALLSLDAKTQKDMARGAKFPGGPAVNFTPNCKMPGGKKAGQRYPYRWEAHHIIPGSAFYYETESGPVFTQKQYGLLVQTDYTINHGHNIIMLPKELFAVFIHFLIQHPGDHPEYTQLAMAKLKDISKAIQKLIDEEKPHEKILADFFKDLKAAEESLWTVLVALGKKVAAGLWAKKRFVSPLVRYSTKEGKALAALS